MPATKEFLPVSEDDGGAYHQIFQSLETGLARVNLEGYFLEVNARFAALLGHQPDTLVGRHVGDITHPDDLATSLALMDAALAGDTRPFTLTQRLVLANGGPVWVRIQGLLLRDAQGQPLQFVGLVHEEQTHTMLSSSPAATVVSPEGCGAIASMSHALRTPLNAMLGFAQLLRVDPSQPLSPAQREKVAHIEQSGAQLLTLLSDVIDLAHIESQRLPLQIQLLPLGPLLDDVLTQTTVAAAQAGIQLQSQFSDEALCVWADRDRLRQILLKLLTHAIRQPGDEGRILLEVQSLNHQVAITVSDTRNDLTAEQQSQLFDMPSTGHEPSPSDGAHLGLHIVKRLAELMQGRVEVASAPGMGTRLRVWLPQGQTMQPVADEAFPVKSAFGHLAGIAGEQPLTVLYAEDNVVNIELVRQVMRMRSQWRLEVAYCGQDAITMALNEPPDLLLLDMHLGDMSGLDVSSVLARQAHTANIPRVALSADVLPDRVRDARAQGFVDYLTKPLDVGRLLRLLDRVAELKTS